MDVHAYRMYVTSFRWLHYGGLDLLGVIFGVEWPYVCVEPCFASDL
jgi:hypothetical protein